QEALRGILRHFTLQMSFLDPPRHTRVRGLVSKAFTPRTVEAMRPHIQETVDGLLDAVQETGQMDVIRDLAYPLPAILIAELLGLPRADRLQFKAWSEDIAALVGGLSADSSLDERARRAERSHHEMLDYFQGILAARRRQPRPDLLSALLAIEERGDVLTEE